MFYFALSQKSQFVNQRHQQWQIPVSVVVTGGHLETAILSNTTVNILPSGSTFTRRMKFALPSKQNTPLRGQELRSQMIQRWWVM